MFQFKLRHVIFTYYAFFVDYLIFMFAWLSLNELDWHTCRLQELLLNLIKRIRSFNIYVYKFDANFSILFYQTMPLGYKKPMLNSAECGRSSDSCNILVNLPIKVVKNEISGIFKIFN